MRAPPAGNSVTAAAGSPRQGGGLNWDDLFRGGTAGTAGAAGGAGGGDPAQRAQKAAEEAFYSVGDFFRDVERDLGARRAQSEKRRGGQPAGLWEELADLGEEFVEFLEQVRPLAASLGAT